MDAGEKATQHRNVFAASSVFFVVLAHVRTLFTTWKPLSSLQKSVAYLGAQLVSEPVRRCICSRFYDGVRERLRTNNRHPI
jgi:hypothetical protein